MRSTAFPETLFFFFPFAIPFLIVAASIIASIYYNKKRTEVLGKLSNILRGEVPKFSLVPTFNGEYQGLKFRIELLSSGKNTPPYLKIYLFKSFGLKLTVYKESIFSELGEKLGLVHEVKTNDPDFDKEFLIFSNLPNQAISYFADENKKAVIREFFINGFRSISADGKRILIQKPNYNINLDLSQQNITGYLERLVLLLQGL